MNGMAIMENIRRYRTIASLYRQTAAFRPLHSCSLLAQARDWEHRAVTELEAYYEGFCHAASGNAPAHTASSSIEAAKPTAAIGSEAPSRVSRPS